MTEPVLAIVAEKRVVAVLTTIAEDDIPNISHEFEPVEQRSWVTASTPLHNSITN